MRTVQLHVAAPEKVSRGSEPVEPSRRAAARAATQQELRGRNQQLHTSTRNPHPESLATTDAGFDEWARLLTEDVGDLLDPRGGTPVSWRAGRGWMKRRT